MARLFADEDFSYLVIQRLHQLGHDILMAHEACQASQGIDDIVALANRIHQQLQGTPILLNQLLRVNRPSS
jgi:hypothetical protein